MREKISFELKIGVMDIYRFLLNYNYRSVGGIFGVIISIGCLVCLGLTYSNNSMTANILYLIGGLLFTVIQPIMLLRKASVQVLTNPVFRKPLEYILEEDGITIKQEEESTPVKWDSVVRIVETKNQILVYTSRVNACIWPKNQIQELDKVKKMLASYTNV